jgi:hypothetical protein
LIGGSRAVGGRAVGGRTVSVITVRRSTWDHDRGQRCSNRRSVTGAQPLANVPPSATIMTINFDLNYIAAPMVNQSDTPFRALVHNHGATLTYTEMLRPVRLLSDPDYLAFHRRALGLGRSSSTGPVIVQVCGNDQEVIVRGARAVVDLCDGIGMSDSTTRLPNYFHLSRNETRTLSDAFSLPK